MSLSQLERLGVRLWVVGFSQLRCAAAPGVMTPSLLAEIKRNRAALIAELEDRTPAVVVLQGEDGSWPEPPEGVRRVRWLYRESEDWARTMADLAAREADGGAA